MSPPGFWELVALAVLALLVFGPDKLPSMLRSAGRTIGSLQREARSAMDDLKAAGDLDEVRGAAAELQQEVAGVREEAESLQQHADEVTDAVRPRPRRGGRRARSRGDSGSTSAEAATEPAGSEGGQPAGPAPFDPDTP